jgi:precorrin-6B methylase 2
MTLQISSVLFRSLRITLAALSLLHVFPAKAVDAPAQAAPARRDVPYVATPQVIVDKLLEMAAIKPGDVVYDLGCGDGRVVVTAAKRYGVRAVGVDIDPRRVKESLANARANKVEHLVSI